MSSSRVVAVLASGAFTLAVGCGDDDGPDLVPDFAVPDVNTNSPRYGEAVSPRNYVGAVSAWYFGHAT